MPLGTFRLPGTGLFPFALGLLLMSLAALFLLSRALASKTDPKDRPPPGEAEIDLRQLLLFFGATLFSLFLLPLLGYPAATFLLLFFLLRTLGIRTWGLLLILSLSVAVLSHLFFVEWLKIPLPKGWIGL
jgi:hypothetical protein